MLTERTVVVFRSNPEPLEKTSWVPQGVGKLSNFDVAELGTVSMYLFFLRFLILARKVLEDND